MSYLNELNDAQRIAVENFEGPMMVLAGAGSGKTRVLTYRIAHLIEKNIDPFNILSLTFTNKASREMKSRIERIIGSSESRNLWMGTFHSVFAKILRIESEKIGYPSNFTIYDTDDAKSVIKSIVKEMNLDDKVYKPNLIYNRISSAKNNLISENKYANNQMILAEDAQSGKPHLVEIYKKYQLKCFRSGAMDFDDLLFKTNVLLHKYPDILNKYQNKFKFILVDEFQDTNFSQFMILKQLAAKFENICVVGDDAQSIYGFRGANIENILNFKKIYPDTKVFKLEQNYRSTKTIVSAANSLIQKNKSQLKKEVWTDNKSGELIKLFKGISDIEEGQLVANEMMDLRHNHQADFDKMAILYRTNAQSRAFEDALRRKDIPYRIYGGLSFYQRKEVKDLLAYFRITVNQADDEAFKRIINYPARGIGKTTLEKLSIHADKFQVSIWEVAKNSKKYACNFNSGTLQKLENFVTMVESFEMKVNTENAYDLGNKIATSTGILKELYSDKSPEGLARYDNIQELLSALKDFTEKTEEDGNIHTLGEFMQEVALLTDQDNDDNDDVKKVSLMTVHAAKGLEFPFVFIVGMEENLFPSQLSLNSRSDLEEERRLFYVALTRAEERAFLSYADTRFKWGNMIYCEPSRFINEINQEYIETNLVKEESIPQNFNDLFSQSKSTRKSTSNYSFPKRKLKKINENEAALPFEGDDTSELKNGDIVEHARFGKGIVEKVEKNAANTKAFVNFDNFGQKQLLLKFAKLKILNE